MKFHVLSPDGRGQIDGTVTTHLLKHFPNMGHSMEAADVILVPISFFIDYTFSNSLRAIKKPWILIDFMEYVTFWDQKDTHLFGKNHEVALNLQNDEWKTFSDWVADNPPVLYFKRELLEKDVSDTVKPIEFPCYIAPQIVQTREAFNARPIEIFSSWGYSHESRPRIHGDMFRALATHGVSIISHWDQFNGYFQNPCARTWVTIFSPHYVRVPIDNILQRQAQSKISLSLPGGGVKCFRSTESPTNSIMALHDDSIAWSIPWVHGENCIRLTINDEFISLDEATRRDDLYDIYLASLDTVDKYRSIRYVNEYILPEIYKLIK